MRQWSKPIALARLRVREIPNRSGVYVLLRSENDPSSVLKIGSARSLRDVYTRVVAEPDANWPVRPAGFLYFESLSESEEEKRFLAEYKRKRGQHPMYNSGF
tara:strand:+ start:6229 stop:6534 length:306 start_codon:yes stop_codon:yes gene_type:complete